MTSRTTIKPSANRQSSFVRISILMMLGILPFSCETLDDEFSFEAQDVQSIVGGENTNYEKWKSVIALVHQQGMYASICTGTFISPQVILTAGHCVYYPQEGIDAVAEPSSLKVLGGSNIFRFSKVVNFPKIEKVVKHSSWRGNLNVAAAVDLAMVKLEKPVPGIQSHPVRSSRLSQYTEGTIVGYGLAGSDENSSGIHRAGDTTVLRVFQSYVELGDPSGTCQGDSGGPFFTTENGKDVVSGVTSFGVSNTCYANGGGYSVNVQTYRSWIDNTMKTLVGYDLSNVPKSPAVEEPKDDPANDLTDDEDNNPANSGKDDPSDDDNETGNDNGSNDENPNEDNSQANDDADYPDGDGLEPNSVRSSTGCRLWQTAPPAAHLLYRALTLLF